MTSRRFLVWLAWITAGGLAFRLAYLGFADEAIVSGDGSWYHFGANFLADGKGFVDPYGYVFADVRQPGADHPPGWTVVLGAASFMGLRSWTAHQIVACLVGAAAIPVLGYAGRRLAGARAGLVTAVIAAFYPNFWMYEGQLLSETLVILIAAVVVLLALRFRDSPTMRHAAVVGVACGLLTLVRAEQVLLLGFLLVPLTMLVRHVPLRRRLVWLTAAVGAAVLVLAPWMIFNLARYQEPTLLTTNLGGAISIGNCDRTYRGKFVGYWVPACYRTEAIIGVDAHNYTLAAELAARHKDTSWLDLERRELGLRYARRHLGEIPAVVLAREGRTWGVFRPFQQMQLDLIRGDSWVVRAGFFAFWVLAALAVRGVVVLRRQRIALCILGAFIATVIVTSAITFGQTRYRVPADVSIVLLAGAAFHAPLFRRPSDGPHASRDSQPVAR